jgi:hypothetical protein
MVRRRSREELSQQTSHIVGPTANSYCSDTANARCPRATLHESGPAPTEALALVGGTSANRSGGFPGMRSTCLRGPFSDIDELSARDSQCARSRGTAGHLRPHAVPLYRGRSHQRVSLTTP